VANAANGIVRTVTVAQTARPLLPSTYRTGVYETKLTARTSVIKEMHVKFVRVGNRYDAVNNIYLPMNVSVKIHYRAPVTKRYTIVMAYSGDGDGFNYTSSGYGRMWTTSSQTAFTFGGETSFVSAQDTNMNNSPIGKKGRSIPVEFKYHDAANPDAPAVHFAALATLNRKKETVSGYSGFAYGENIYPIRCVLHPNAEQGLSRVVQDMEYRTDVIWHLREADEDFKFITQPCLVPVAEDLWMLKEAHFFGTFTTRRNEVLSKRADTCTDFEKVKTLVDNRVPKRQRR